MSVGGSHMLSFLSYNKFEVNSKEQITAFILTNICHCVNEPANKFQKFSGFVFDKMVTFSTSNSSLMDKISGLLEARISGSDHRPLLCTKDSVF